MSIGAGGKQGPDGRGLSLEGPPPADQRLGLSDVASVTLSVLAGGVVE